MMFETDIRPLDLTLTLDCGQACRWKELEQGFWTGVVGKHMLTLRQSSGSVAINACTDDQNVVRLVRGDLRADDDIARIQRALAKDQTPTSRKKTDRALRMVKK